MPATIGRSDFPLEGSRQGPVLLASKHHTYNYSEAMANWRFTSQDPGGHASGLLTVLDIMNETVHLALARRKYLLVLLPTFLLAFLVPQGLNDYAFYGEQRLPTTFSEETRRACLNDSLIPWLMAGATKSLSASQQEDFYTSVKLNCSMYKTPVEAWGTFAFINGSLQLKNLGGAFTLAPLPVMSSSTRAILTVLCGIMMIWVFVAVAWGLQVASTTTPSYNTRPTISMAPQKISLSDLIEEQFSYRVLKGVFQVSLTKALAWTFFAGSNLLVQRVIILALNSGLKGQAMMAFWARKGLERDLANPLRLLFLLSSAAAALEPGMWGFKALWRGIKLTRGNRWNCFLIHVMLSLWEWLFVYLAETIRLKPAHLMNESFWGPSLRSIGFGSLRAACVLPAFFLVPVFYFFCKAWREKVAAMA